MIRYSLRRAPGGRRYSSTDRTIARLLDLAGAPDTLSPEAIAAMTNPDGIRVVVDVLFELESNRLSRPATPNLRTMNTGGGIVAPSAGSLANLVDGNRNSSAENPAVRFPSHVTIEDDPVVEVVWPGERTINLVEVHGDPVVGQITAATVDYRAPGGTWIQGVGSATGAGRLAIPIPEVQATGIRVHIEASEAVGGIAVVEVDPMWILDVSDEVESLEVEWSREADPGSTASPVGNYEASTLELTLDDTDGFWNPATNASLDVGHRVEVALGVRYRPEVGRREIARNGALNPSFEGDLGGVSTASGTLSYGFSTERAYPGAGGRSLKSYWTGAPTSVSQIRWAGHAVPAGTTHTYKARVFMPESNLVHPTSFSALARNDAAARYFHPPGGYAVTLEEPYRPGEWNTLAVTFTVPAGETLGSVYFRGVLPSAAAATDVYYWDALQAGEDVAYFDGDTPDEGNEIRYEWTGTPHASASIATVPIYGSEVEEMLPAGVFYTDPYDTDSDSLTVAISAVDRLGRRAEVAVSEEVATDVTVEDLLRGLAQKYLDLDGEQVVVTDTIGGLILPYAYPTGNLGTYLADLAKATGGTIHVDPLERLVLTRRTDTTLDVAAEITDTTSLIRFRRPPSYDVTTSIVSVTAAPLELDATVTDLWAMPSGGIQIPAGETYPLVARYDNPPALNGFVSGIIADGAYSITRAAFYSDRAELDIANEEARVLVIADLRIRGNVLVEGSLTARKEHAPSVARYGPREFSTEARLAQTQGQLEQLAEVLLDSFRSLDDDGNRRLPDLEFSALGLLHLSTGDRVSLSYPAKGLGGDYTILSRKLVYEGGAITMNDARAREAAAEPFLILDVNPLDDVYVLGY